MSRALPFLFLFMLIVLAGAVHADQTTVVLPGGGAVGERGSDSVGGIYVKTGTDGSPTRMVVPVPGSEAITSSINDAVTAAMAGTDYTHRDLKGATFKNAMLAGARFTGSNLSNANFANTNLQGADFSRANLSGANFTNAQMTSVNLTGADLRGANLKNATLDQAIVTGAHFENAILTNVDMTNVIRGGTTPSSPAAPSQKTTPHKK